MAVQVSQEHVIARNSAPATKSSSKTHAGPCVSHDLAGRFTCICALIWRVGAVFARGRPGLTGAHDLQNRSKQRACHDIQLQNPSQDVVRGGGGGGGLVSTPARGRSLCHAAVQVSQSTSPSNSSSKSPHSMWSGGWWGRGGGLVSTPAQVHPFSTASTHVNDQMQ